MFTDELFFEFAQIKDHYGSRSLARVEAMLQDAQRDRHPLQKAAKYVLPGLQLQPWRDPKDIPEIYAICQKLNSLYPQIRAEVQDLLIQTGALKSYAHYQVQLPEWRALYIVQQGRVVEENRFLVPSTFKFYQDYLQTLLCPLGEMHFSILQPGTHIPPHADLWNFSLNLHFAVKIPQDCGIRVAMETRQWQEGQCLLFDYSFEHEAWNRSEDVRICLLMDVWNPELTPAERLAVMALITELRKLMQQEEL